MSILYRGPSIDASYQVSVHLAEGFQRRRLKCEKLMWKVNGRRMPSDGKSSHCLWQGELKTECISKSFVLHHVTYCNILKGNMTGMFLEWFSTKCLFPLGLEIRDGHHDMFWLLSSWMVIYIVSNYLKSSNRSWLGMTGSRGLIKFEITLKSG